MKLTELGLVSEFKQPCGCCETSAVCEDGQQLKEAANKALAAYFDVLDLIDVAEEGVRGDPMDAEVLADLRELKAKYSALESATATAWQEHLGA